MLYMLGACVFPDNRGNRVNVTYHQLLHPLEEVNKYSWGTSIIAYLNGQLIKAYMKRTSQVNANLDLLQLSNRKCDHIYFLYEFLFYFQYFGTMKTCFIILMFVWVRIYNHFPLLFKDNENVKVNKE